jgi:DUF438 domain-containing protein
MKEQKNRVGNRYALGHPDQSPHKSTTTGNCKAIRSGRSEELDATKNAARRRRFS